MKGHLLATLSASLIFLGGSPHGQCVALEQTIPQSFSDSVFQTSVDGDRMATAAQFAGVGGQVYVYERSGSTWSPETALLPADNSPGDGFGASVAVSGDSVAAASAGPGAVYIFEKIAGAWTETAQFSPFAGMPSGSCTLDLQGDLLVASCDVSASVWIYRRTGGVWAQEQVITNSGGLFVISVSIDGDTLAVGANSAGSAAYIFDFDGSVWSETDELRPAIYEIGLSMGQVALSGDRLLAGALGVLGLTGAGYIFERDAGTWTETATLSPAAPPGSFFFGVELDGDVAVLWSIASAGTVIFNYANGAWTQQPAIPANPAPYATAPYVDLSGDTLVIGSWDYYSPVQFDVMRLGGSYSLYGSGLAGTAGLTPLLTGGLDCPVVGNSFSMNVSLGAPFAPGLFAVGFAPLDLPLFGGSLLVAPPLVVQFPHVLSAAGTFSMPFTATLAFSNISLYAQAGYADAGGVMGFSLTNGLRLQFN